MLKQRIFFDRQEKSFFISILLVTIAFQTAHNFFLSGCSRPDFILCNIALFNLQYASPKQVITKNKKTVNMQIHTYSLSVSKKTNNKFRHAGRLLRNGLNFVFLRGKMYIGTSTEQKTKNTKMAWIRCPSHFSNPSVST